MKKIRNVLKPDPLPDIPLFYKDHLLFCVRTFHETELICSFPAHQMKITLIIPIAEGFCSVQHGSLHLKSVIIHHAKVLCDLTAVLLRSQFTNAALFMRDIIFILPRDGFKIIIPVHRIVLTVVS